MDFVAIDAGFYHSLGLKSNGTVVAWGSNDWGECDVPEPNADFVAIAAGRGHSLGLKTDGTIVAWGSNGWGQCDVPEPNADFVAVAAGGNHSLGLKSSSTVPVALLSVESYWAQGHVITIWRLIDIAGELTFDVFRREESSERYHLMPDADIQRRGNEFSFEDHTTDPGMTYQYRVVIYEDGNAITSFETVVTTPTAAFSLGQNTPNPFNPTTRIEFSLERASQVTLAVYDPSGRLVTTLLDENMDPGTHTAEWDGRDDSGGRLASGVYFYRLTAGKHTLSRKAIVLK